MIPDFATTLGFFALVFLKVSANLPSPTRPLLLQIIIRTDNKNMEWSGGAWDFPLCRSTVFC